MSNRSGRASHNTRRPSGTLRLRAAQGQKCSIGSEQSDNTENPEAVQQSEAWLRTERNRWSIRNRSGLLASGKRLDKRDAARVWREMFGRKRETVT